jgi:hypothetical protein
VFTDTKPQHKCRVLIEEKLDKTGARLEQLPHLLHTLHKNGTMRTATKLMTTTALQKQFCTYCSHVIQCPDLISVTDIFSHSGYLKTKVYQATLHMEEQFREIIHL